MAAVFFPNFGAEERDVLPSSTTPRPVLKNLEIAWRRLFDDAALFADDAFVAWLNTPLAAAEAARRGLRLFGASPDIVRVVHDKAFCAAVVDDHGLLEESVADVVTVIDAVDLTLERLRAAMVVPPSWPAHVRETASFTVKPRFGSSGRGRLDARRPETWAAALPRLAGCGGVVVEPWLTRVLDLSAQWLIHDDGRLELLGTTRADTSPGGVWHGAHVVIADDGLAHASVDGSISVWDRQLVDSSVFVVEAAARAGHRGPCGVDAFVYRSPQDHVPRLRLVELNARFTAGLVAVGLCRGLPPGTTVAFAPKTSAALATKPSSQ